MASVDAPLAVVTESPVDVAGPATSAASSASVSGNERAGGRKASKCECCTSFNYCAALSGKEYLSSHAAVSISQIIGVLGVLLAFAAFGFYDGIGRGLAFASGVCGTFTLLINEFVARHRALKMAKSATVSSSSGTWS